MNLKGSATIELTNAYGSKEVIRHDNIVTNAVNEMLKSYRGELPPLFKISNKNDMYVRNMFGGIMLFNDTLNNDPEDYFFPSTRVTGYASLDAYGGSDPARGGFNELESGSQEDGSYKFVWDFATSQANGIIKSLALCPNMMGQIGATLTPDSSSRSAFVMANYNKEPFHSVGYMLDGDDMGGNAYYYFVVAVVGDIAYAIDLKNIYMQYDSAQASLFIKNTGKLSLYKFNLSNESISLKSIIGKSNYIGIDEISMPDEFLSIITSEYDYASVFFNFDNESGKLFVMPGYRNEKIDKQQTCKYLEINLKNNNEVALREFTNTTAGLIDRSIILGVKYRYELSFSVFKYYILAVAVDTLGSPMLYSINKNDNTIVKCISDEDGNPITNITSFEPVFYNDRIVIIKSDVSSNNYYYIIDMQSGIFRRTNASSIIAQNNVDIGSKVLFGRTGEQLTFYPTFNPFIVTTKNNLDSPVTKTSSQTMKITYTLKESGAV